MSGSWEMARNRGWNLLYAFSILPVAGFGHADVARIGPPIAPRGARHALWGKADAFDTQHPFFTAIQRLARLRREQAALRYGRFYFRPLSGNGADFNISPYAGGVLAFSRVLDEQLLLVVANTDTTAGFTGEVVVDVHLSPARQRLQILYSNKAAPVAPTPVRATGPVRIHEVHGSTSAGPACVVGVTLGPMEIHILGK